MPTCSEMCCAIPGDNLCSVRDWALLALGMAKALRRSKLATLQFADLKRVTEGLCVTMRFSKTDQDRAGATIAIPEERGLRPKTLLDAWLARGGIMDGFLLCRLTAGLVGRATFSP